MIASKIALAVTLTVGAVAFSFAGASAGYLKDHTHKVKCDKGDSLQKKVDKAHPGDTLEVSGVCTENVVIRVPQINIIGLDGAGINFFDDPNNANTSTLDVEATNVQIRNLTITVRPGRYGIIVHRNGSARIERNTITGLGTGTTGAGQGTTGILVTDNSYARIGGGSDFLRNTITNHRRGITVRLGSGADIFFNTISGNDYGVNINNIGAIDIADNAISDNRRGLNMSTDSSAALSGSTSSTGGANTFTNNTEAAIRCRLGAALSNGPPGNSVLQIDGGGNGSLVNTSTFMTLPCHVTTNPIF